MGTRVRYIGIHEEGVELFDTGDFVEKGGVVEVDDELAGRAPSGKPGAEDYDAGAGLLAQTANWELADMQAASTTKPKRTREVTTE